jgi:hypothetical protein
MALRTDPTTGLPALTAKEVERIGEPEGHVELWDPDQYVEIEGYVVRAADPSPVVNSLTGDSVPRRVRVRTRHGLLAIREGPADLAALFSAKSGAPFVIKYLRSGRFDVLVGEPDTAELPEEPLLSEIWKATASPNLVHSQRVAEREAGEAANLAAALAVLYPEPKKQTRADEAQELFPRRS